MTQAADLIRDRRRSMAAPGGQLDKIVRFLAVGLPALVGVVAALMVISPLSPRRDVSFLLDRNKVAIAGDRLRLDNALYRGEDRQGRPFSLSAGEAVQRSIAEPVVQMRDLVARILLGAGPAVLSADHARYDFDKEIVEFDGMVRFAAADGYRMEVRGVAIDLKEKLLSGDDGVEGAVPAGTFSARSIRADLDARTLALEGQARLRMIPGRLQLPRGTR